MEKISGIYAIVHIESNRYYVGSAVDIYKRWSEHKSELLKNYHDNQRLQNFWNKYGKDAFEFKILEVVAKLADLLIREQYWIDYYQSNNRNLGFNIRKKAESNFGLEHKPETIEKIRTSNIGKHFDQVGEGNHFFGKVHTEESLAKMRTPRSSEFKETMRRAAAKRWEGHSLSKICLNCQIEFTTILCKDREFCSKKCSSKYYGKLSTQNNTIEKTCLLCPNTFRTSISQDKKYCGRICWAVSMKGNKNQIKKKALDK